MSSAYPTTTAFTINVGGATGCAESLPQPIADCATPVPGDMATAPAPGDMATPASDLATPPPSAPSVTLLAPADGASYTLGSTVTVQATASASATRVVASWTRFGYTSTYPLSLSGGVWTLSLAVTQRAGTRTISVTATDAAGRSTTTPTVSIDVR